LGVLREGAHLENLDVDEKTIKRIDKKWNGEEWIGLLWLRIRACGERL
jgi:hypothetical protein